MHSTLQVRRLRRRPLRIVLGACLGILVFVPPASAEQGAFDPTPVWPLCGRIAEDPPAGWLEADGCPAGRWGNPAFTDAPISSTFGPRLLVSEGMRYDFHRGIDIACPIGTPVFAFAPGVVRKAGPDPGYSDPLVQLRHYRPGHDGQCSGGGGCYHTNYLHMSGWTVAIGETVERGQLIGYSGASQSGFEHVHFEIRDAPPQDPFSAWQRDAIHPLAVLPYPDTGASNITVEMEPVDVSIPTAPVVRATITIPMSVELDLERVEVELYERQGDGGFVRVVQPGETPVGATPEGVGYDVEPPWFSMHSRNRQYTYKNSSGFPWSSFEQGGAYESPFWAVLPASYDPNVHLDAQDPADFQVGLFNGVSVAPDHTNASSSEYVVRFGFHALTGVADPADLCVRLRAADVRGQLTPWVEQGCPGPPVDLWLDRDRLTWSSAPPAGAYDVVTGDLDLLRESRGDFGSAAPFCIADDLQAQQLPDATVPAPGQGVWFLVRAVPGPAPGSYDSGGSAQVQTRDGEIVSCP